MLRHDPEIMMIGEVRDIETAVTAIQVALTGHLVFSTLHTNDAAGGVTRLADMGIEPYLISSTVQCFIAQRLVRKLCERCKKKAALTPVMLKDFEGDIPAGPGAAIYQQQGCEACHHTGYSGREAIYEFLILDDELRQMILARAASGDIKAKAVAKGMTTLRRAGWGKVKEGKTTIEEVIRVTQEEG
jgi:type II secretory ATPase GspE/PulE/Tfp pilus assembly ATPase PilB-like protein